MNEGKLYRKKDADLTFTTVLMISLSSSKYKILSSDSISVYLLIARECDRIDLQKYAGGHRLNSISVFTGSRG